MESGIAMSLERSFRSVCFYDERTEGTLLHISLSCHVVRLINV